MNKLFRVLLLASILVVLSSISYAQVAAPINGFCEQGGLKASSIFPVNATNNLQQSFPTCTVTVYNFGGSVLSTIYSNAGGTPLSNPFTANSTGQWQFYAANGDYIVVISGGGLSSPYTLYSDIKVANASAGIGGGGTNGTIPKWTSSSAIGNSQITESGQTETIASSGATPAELDLGGASSAFVVGLKAPSGLAGSIKWTLPVTDVAGCLQSNGSGTLSLSACPGGVADPGGNGIVIRTALNTTTFRTLTGTALQIAITNGTGVAGNPTVAIDPGYVGQSSITTLGTITTGVWNGTAVPAANGGTGNTTNTANGVLYGNGGSAILATAQGAAFSILTANAGAPSFSQSPQINTKIIIGVGSSQTGQLTFLNNTNNNTLTFQAGITGSNLTFTWPSADGTGGNDCLKTNESGALSFGSCGGGGGSGTVNNGSSFAIAGYQTNGTTVGPFGNGSSTGLFSDANNTFSVVPTAISASTRTFFTRFVTPADTTLTASTEAPGMQFGGNTSQTTVTRQFATGALATQRENIFIAPTYSFAGVSTATNVATVAINNSPIAGTNATLTNSWALWVQAGNTLHSGRSYFGQANGTTDWLTSFRFGTTSIANAASLANDGHISILGGSRSSDLGGTQPGQDYPIAGAFFGVNDSTNTHNLDSVYVEAHMKTAQPASTNSTSLGIEVDPVNFKSLAANLYDPYSGVVNNMTGGIHLASGGGGAYASTFRAHFAIDIINNTNTFDKGIVFASTSLARVGALETGTGNGAATAIAMARGHQIVWYTSTGVVRDTLDADSLTLTGQGYTFTPGTGSTSGAELNNWLFAAQTLTISGAVATQRFTLFQQPTISGAFTTTTAATVDIVNAPTVGGGGTITNAYSLLVEAGRTSLVGGVNVPYTVATGNALNVTSTGRSSGPAVVLTDSQTTPNAGDTSDSALTISYSLTASSATNELIIRAMNFTITNALTGGGAITNVRNLDMATSTNVGSVTTNLYQIFFEIGTISASPVNSYGLYINSLAPGSTQTWGIFDANGVQWKLPQTAFASLPTGGATQNGAILFCNDCIVAATCAGAGTGAIAKRLNAVWVCN